MRPFPAPEGQTAAHLPVNHACDIFHKINIAGRTSRYSAWFNRFGELLDCERIDSLHRSYSCTAAEYDLIRSGAWFARQHIRNGYKPA